ncbi:hypothetical protein J5N97_027824 [Dioscorea zingiberensis]|uniref:Uncharacterized protein n=1 Tax=Dioscorea zingiberensis TaxID=325984 RepID=A0A9D5H482_9LILI|nr:hypothetical protein J5N97_027824 [Dioscorea zingiberensis]
MQKRRSPILRKAMELIAQSMTPMGKVRKPIGRELRLFKKAKSFRLLKHYNFAYIGEYEFSPSSTPLFHHRRTMDIKKRSLRFFCFLCGGAGISESSALENLSLTAEKLGSETPEPLELGGEDEDDSVDTRAEKFIEMFYQEMRIQRQDSLSALF